MIHDRIFELRDYTLHPGQRETLIELFEAKFIAPQNDLGANVRGIFRDIDRPDHFVWLRSFADIETRLAALTGFYGGPIWAEHRSAANATMIDSDDVHLLRPAGPMLSAGPRFEAALIVIEIYPELPDDQLATAIAGAPGVVAAFMSASVENNFPRLPVQADKVAVVLRAAPNFGRPDPIRGLPQPLHLLRLRPTAQSPLQLAGPRPSARDFDFLQGEWSVQNRRLRKRNVGSADWDEFPSTARFWCLLDGVANVDEFDCTARGFKGMSLRALDSATEIWAIWWISSMTGTLLPPVHGGFVRDTGCFVGKDVDDGHPVLVGFTWFRDAPSPRWEQAFSYDEGESWEVNWTMQFRKN